jgi:hypothetical protein
MNVFYTRYIALQILYDDSLYSELQTNCRYKHAIFNSVRSTCKVPSYLSIKKVIVVSQHVTVIKSVHCHRIVNYFYANKNNCHQFFVDKLDLKFKHFMATYDISLPDISKTRIPE